MASRLPVPFGGIFGRRRPRPPLAPRRPTAAPEQRAEALLLRHLTPTQKTTYLRDGWFEVRGQDGSIWTIDRKGGSRNVKCTRCTCRNGTQVYGMQVYCTDLEDAPRADKLLLQKLCIEATGGRGLPRRHGATLCDEDLFMTRGRRRRPAGGTGTPDPIALNQAAFEHRLLDQLEEAERHLREAIEIEDAQVAADSPKRPHRRNNLAIVLMRAGKLDEAGRWNAEAWRLKAGQHDVTSGRILFIRITLSLLRDDRDVHLYVGQLKTLLERNALECRGDIATTWDVPDVLEMLRGKLLLIDAELLGTIVEALDEPSSDRSMLDTFEAWRTAPAVPLEAPWPAEGGGSVA